MQNIIAPLACLAVPITGFTAFLATRKHSIVCCKELVGRLYPHILSPVRWFLDAEDCTDRSCRTDMHGVAGLWKMWRNRVVLVRLCQLRGEMEAIKVGEMLYVTERASSLTHLCFKAAALGTAKRFSPKAAEDAYRAVVKVYAEIADRTHSFYADDDVPLCASKLASVL